MPELRVDFQALANLISAIENAIDAIESSLSEQEAQVQWISQVWEGAAAYGFQRTITAWRNAATDLRQQLTFLHELVSNAANNHADAVATNTHMWRV
ncbi:MAG TPA: WXG100 family type VII secretion target [Pseudonocardiaceae bacterium]|nr:WXG100 family type VII secretion target [Pseudonocardiaceae bacterium]